VALANYRKVLPLLELSHGVCFALLWTTAVEFGRGAAPDHLKATAQVGANEHAAPAAVYFDPLLLPCCALLSAPFTRSFVRSCFLCVCTYFFCILLVRQGVLSTAYFVLGQGLGSVAWSAVAARFGFRAAYGCGAAAVCVSGLVLVPKLAPFTERGGGGLASKRAVSTGIIFV
jgi:hypothetical protein